MLVTVAQSSTMDMKALPGIVGSKEVRLCMEGDTLLGSAKGCITPLSLLYDEGRKVQWFLDEALLSVECWRLGTSGDGAEPGTVVDIPVAKLKEFLAPTGHWASIKTLDCSQWAVAAPARADSGVKPEVKVGPGKRDWDDTSKWYQPPYKTASGWVL